MENYLFFIGGTGARIYRAFLHACAAGAVSADRVHAFLIDADSLSAAASECRGLYRAYKNYRAILNMDGAKNAAKTSAFHCDIRMREEGVISPVPPEITRLQQVTRDEAENRALAWFYTEEERMQSLEKGFYARPNIGCVFFQDFRHSALTDALNEIERQVRNTQSGGVRVVLAGSVFGGTGAAGIPSLVKMIRKQCGDDSSRLRCCGVLATPYFCMAEKEEANNDIDIRGEDFFFNTREALKYYKFSQAFDTVYLVGRKSLDLVSLEYTDGGARQKNKPHIIELYAAMAVANCLSGTAAPEKTEFWSYIADSEGMGWQNMPSQFYRLADMLRAQAILENEIYPYMDLREETDSPIWSGIYQWYPLYHMSDAGNRRSMAAIRGYSRSFLEWVYYMQSGYINGQLARNGNVRLCGPVIDCFEPAGTAGTGGPDPSAQKKKLRERFNDLVDTAANIEYALSKAAVILSYLGVAPPVLAELGCAGLLIRLFGLSGEQK